MILIVHLLFGAAIGSIVRNIPLAILLAFLSHYLLDLIPHTEYSIENIEKKQWRRTRLQISRVLLDFCSGLVLILILSNNQPIIYICAFFAILPDGLSISNSMIKSKFLQNHSDFHRKKIHFLKYKKIPAFWRILSQVITIIVSIILMSKNLF